ncbi:hypothetical protein GE09DRAFT_1247959 [Coniochaeta sp. 2T2.1]|nr:hypothetical protein GE09DRAFT_1247959 [Coniochaeta sp. 2T2.1]
MSSPTPLSPSQALASTTRLSLLARRTMVLPEARRGGNDNTLWQTLESGIAMLSRRWTMSPSLPIEHFEVEIRDLWYLFCLSARYIDADCAAQDRLVRIVGVAGGWGVLTRARREGGEGEGEGVEEEARTREGRIWSDLPFLVGDVRGMWKECMMGGGKVEGVEGEGVEGEGVEGEGVEWEGVEGEGVEGEDEEERQRQRVNLTAAIARLVSVGVCTGELGQCGLEVMRLALETEMEEGRVEMMGLVRVWLRYAGHLLLMRCLAGGPTDERWRVGEGGDGGGVEDGFSKDRFVAWKRKLEELRMSAGDDDAEDVKCASAMGYIWDSYHGLR